MPKISVIIPVFNAEKYIEKCLDSVMRQTKKEEIEIIVINDGSTDESDSVIKSYIKNNLAESTIKYFLKENEGVAKTRNYGIKKAKGEYILMVDADDYILETTVEKLFPYIENKIDLIKFKLQRTDENGNILEKVNGPIFEQISGSEAFNKLYSEDILIDSPCVYAINRDFFIKNNFEFSGTYHEDFGLMPLIIVAAKTMVSIPYYLYQYVQASNSITRNDDYEKTIKKMDDVIIHYDNMIETIKGMPLDELTIENIKIYYTNAIILKLEELNKKDKKKYIKEIKKRKMLKNIKIRNFKQLIKKIILNINIKLYLKMR